MKIRRQRPVKGGRVYVSAGVMKHAARIIEQTARHFNVSKSFVENVAMCRGLGIPIEEDYAETQGKVKLRRVK